ncbi:MAG: DUF1800 domain-containing protein [Planctomycetes bacterium]|nr:DUF1800 domain-containing protein [Planctomycetota bacterium]
MLRARAASPTSIALAIALMAMARPAGAQGLSTLADATWDRERAAHLLRRAGFGGQPEDVDRLVAVGRDKAVDSLVDYDKIPANDPPYSARAAWRLPDLTEIRTLDAETRRDATGWVRDFHVAHAQAMREWWLRRMVVTNRPLEEKMTLFWHGLLTSGFREVKSWQLLYDQNEFLRKNALSDFRTLVLGIAKDGAMLRYLDNDKNVRGKPNENFARELLELFTLGVGNYSENDVKEAARALTGWRIGRDGPYLRSRLHDEEWKTILERTGPFGVMGVVDTVLARPAATRHLATCLWAFFAYEDPEPAVVDALAAELRRTKFDLRSAMRTIFKSDAFYSPRALHGTIKSPVELVVGTLRALEIQPQDARRLSVACRDMGQELFQPPNVKGWPGGERWITTSTLVARQNFGRDLVEGEGRVAEGAMMTRGSRPPLPASLDDPKMKGVRAALEKLPIPPDISQPQPRWDPFAAIDGLDTMTSGEIVHHFVTRLLAAPLAQEREVALFAAFSPPDQPFDPKAGDAAARVRDLVYLIVSLPEYQLN